MKIHTEIPMTHEAAWYIMHANGWNHKEGVDGNEFILSLRIGEDDEVVSYNRINKQIKVHREMHAQELLAALKVLRIL